MTGTSRTIATFNRLNSLAVDNPVADGSIQEKSDNAPLKPYPIAAKPGFANVGSTRYYTHTLADGRSFVQVAEEPDERREAALVIFCAFKIVSKRSH